LIPNQQFLNASYYGKFFARKLQLVLLQRRPEEWRIAQANITHGTAPPQSVPEIAPKQNGEQEMDVNGEVSGRKKKKRKRQEAKDEIDVLFEGVKENRFANVASQPTKASGMASGDLDTVLGAIKSAPKSERKRRKG